MLNQKIHYRGKILIIVIFLLVFLLHGNSISHDNKNKLNHDNEVILPHDDKFDANYNLREVIVYQLEDKTVEIAGDTLKIYGHNSPINFDLQELSTQIDLNINTLSSIEIHGAPVTIEGQTFDGKDINVVDSPNSVIRNNVVKNIAGSGIRIINSPNSVISNNIVENIYVTSAYAYGIYVKNSSQTIIESNTIRNLKGSEPQSFVYGIFTNDSSGLIIKENSIISLTTDSTVSTAFGIYSDFGSDLTIENNSIELINAGKYGVGGIMLYQIDNPTILNNNITNIIGSYSTYGIHVNVGSGTIHIENNNFTNISGGTSYGIKTDGTGVTNILNNNITAISGSNSYGITADGTGVINIENNILRNITAGSESGGIKITNYDTGLISLNEIEIISTGTNGRLAFGIYTQVQKSIIENNIIHNIATVLSINGESYGINSIDAESTIINNDISDVYASSSSTTVNSTGISVSSTSISNSSIVRNIISNVTAESSVVSQAFGLYCENLIESTIEFNLIMNITSKGTGQLEANDIFSNECLLNTYIFEIGNLYNITWAHHHFDLSYDEYYLYQDGKLIDSGIWIQSRKLNLTTINLDVGKHIYTILIANFSSHVQSYVDTITIYIEETMESLIPSLIYTENVTMEYSTTNKFAIWEFADDNPDKFEIYQEGKFVVNGTWSSNILIKYNIDKLDIGTYNFTIIVFDLDGNSATNTIFISVKTYTEIPEIFRLDSVTLRITTNRSLSIEQGSIEAYLMWIIRDNNPANYSIFQDDQIVEQGNWTSDDTLTYPLEDLIVGNYSFRIIAYDISGNSISDTVIINVADTTEPTISTQDDMNIEQEGIENNITWHVSDFNPDFYYVYLNGTEIKNATWTSEIPILIDLDDLIVGYYNFTLYVNDLYNNSAVDTVIIIVRDTLAPTIKGPREVFFTEGETGNNIVWRVYDENPYAYYILENGIRVINGTWGPDSSDWISVDIDSLPWGFYNLTIAVIDLYNNTAFDYVHVTVYSLLAHTSPFSSNTTTQATTLGVFGNIDPTYIAGAGAVLLLAGGVFVLGRRR